MDALVKGKIVSITDYGAFVELEPGIEGLVHVSEMSWTKKAQAPLEGMVNVGDQVEAQVLEVDSEKPPHLPRHEADRAQPLDRPSPRSTPPA